MAARWTDEEIYLVMDRAHSLAQQGLYEDSAQIFAGILEIDPRNRYCRNALASLILLLGDPDNALAVADDGLKQIPAEAAFHARRAEALIALRRFAEAQREVTWLADNSDEAALQSIALRLEAGREKSSGASATSTQRRPITGA